MATKAKALAAYRPRIIQGKTADVKDASNIIAGRTSATYGGVLENLMELMYVVTLFLGSGRPLKLPGLGTFSPSISLDGTINVNLRVDREVLSELNKDKEGFKGDIVNKDMIGKTYDDLVARWNEEHPEDPVVP